MRYLTDMNTELKASLSNDEISGENLEKHFADVTLNNVKEKCSTWLDSCGMDDVLSDCSDFTETSGSSLYTNVTDNSEMSYVIKNENAVITNLSCQNVSNIYYMMN